MVSFIDKNFVRKARHKRLHIRGDSLTPRLYVFRSNSHIYAQIIDDFHAVTLTAASSLDKAFVGRGSNIDGAKKVGTAIAKKAIDIGITKVVFDRGGYLYHGRVKALAEAARSAGLLF